MKTIVAVSSSTTPDYAALVVINALFWRDVIGFEPRPILVGTEGGWRNRPQLRLVVEAFDRHGIGYRFIGPTGNYQEATLAQNARQHAACYSDINADAWVMPADADLLPLRREFYQTHLAPDIDESVRAVLYYSNGDHFAGKQETFRRIAAGQAYQSIPTCHVSMRARDWRHIYELIPNDITSSTRKTLDAWLKPKIDSGVGDVGFQAWMSDQRIVTEVTISQPWFGDMRVDDKNQDAVIREDGVVFVCRRGHSPLDRLDRGCPSDWKMRPYPMGRWTDAHCHRAPFNDEHFDDLMQIIEAHLPQHAAWAREYRERFVAAEGE